MTALVTGAALRLGRAMALELARAGHDVAIHYAGSADAAEDTAKEVRGFGVRAVTLQADLTVEDDMQTLLPRAAQAFAAPITVLMIVPQPPNNDAPPMTTAAIESSSIGSPACAAPMEG